MWVLFADKTVKINLIFKKPAKNRCPSWTRLGNICVGAIWTCTPVGLPIIKK